MFDMVHHDRPLKVLIGCEQSGIVRDAFNALGHDAWSCDLLPSETPSNRHIIGDVRDVMNYDSWDLLAVMHPTVYKAVQQWREMAQGATTGKDAARHVARAARRC